MADSEVNEMPIFQNVNMWKLNLDGSQVPNATGVTLAFSNEPTGIAYDTRTGHLWVSDDNAQKVYDLAPGTDGMFGTADDPAPSAFSVSKGGSMDPEDVTINTDTGDLYIIDGVSAEVYRWAPGPDKKFDGVAPAGDDVVSHFDVGQYGAGDPEGIFYDHTSRSLFVADHTSHKIYQLSTDGQLMNTIDISAEKARWRPR